MTPAWLAVLAVFAVAAPSPAANPSPSDAISALIRFEAPAGWTREDESSANYLGADPVVAFVKGSDRIAIHAYGGQGSVYKTPALFMKGPAATTMGRPPVRSGSAQVAGRKTAVYRREYPLADSDPHEATGRSRRMAVQIFCVLPAAADGRFVVLTFSREPPAQPLDADREKSWLSLLNSVRPIGPKP